MAAAVAAGLGAAVVRDLELELAVFQRTVTHARAGPAYFSAFVSASWITR